MSEPILIEKVKGQTSTWLVTGAAGFIGSHLVEALLNLGQRVRGLDNFSTGKRENLVDIQKSVSATAWKNFEFIEGDICDLKTCSTATNAVDFVLHQAALGSVPRSIKDPLSTHRSNVDGFINILKASLDSNVKRFVYASSSSVYGDHPDLPKVEVKIGQPLSPYAASKRIDEVYAHAFFRSYNMPVIGLRYFNVFGPRQDPDGPYAAVIPRWMSAIVKNDVIEIFGDGETSRDFCFINNVVNANFSAAVLSKEESWGEVFNIALGDRTTLNELYGFIRDLGRDWGRSAGKVGVAEQKPVYKEFRAGDVRHSLADVSKAKQLLGYDPKIRVKDGLKRTFDWFIQHERLG